MEALDLAKYILIKAEMLGKPINNFQLQQILYIIQKYFLSNDKCAFLEYFYAWRIGPVIPRVYCEFSYHAGMPIRIAHFTRRLVKLSFLPDYDEAINNIITQCCRLRPVEMREITCCKGGAWNLIYNHGRGLKNKIPYLMIKSEKCEIDITELLKKVS